MQKGSFEGDIAVKGARECMARAPDRSPEPPMRDGGPAFGAVGRLVILVTIAVIAVYGFVWTSKPRGPDTEAKADDLVVPAPADTALVRRSPPAEAEINSAPPVSTAPRINDEEILIGDVTAARLAFQRAAENGDAQAALALGATFDPLVLKSLGAVGVAADPAQARAWYQKAAELGSRDAPQRLNQLAQSVQ
jgi:hypothetical protein